MQYIKVMNYFAMDLAMFTNYETAIQQIKNNFKKFVIHSDIQKNNFIQVLFRFV